MFVSQFVASIGFVSQFVANTAFVSQFVTKHHGNKVYLRGGPCTHLCRQVLQSLQVVVKVFRGREGHGGLYVGWLSSGTFQEVHRVHSEVPGGTFHCSAFHIF